MLRRFCSALLLLSICSAAHAQELKPYEAVITKDYNSKSGVFKVHRGKEKLYYEIPKALLDKDFLLVTQIAKTREGVGAGGEPIDERVVRWHRRDNKVVLLDIHYGVYADPNQPIHRAVEAANNPGILFSFPVEAVGPNEAPVIEVSKMFLSDTVELTPRYFLGAKIFDPTRCFLESAKPFPENIEVESSLTLGRPPDSGSGAMPLGTATVLMHYSMVKLPEHPMQPRLEDSRVGYFSVGRYDFGRLPDHRVKREEFICRWRLEKKDPQAELSEPIKPIVFYIDPGTPKEWVPWIKKGVEEWQPAFEEAGFKNAILAKDPPIDDPDWSLDDARYSIIRWLPSTVRNAYGPHISDPRSGEILEADVHMFHNVLDLLRTWYFTQVGPLDPRAKSLPLPTELMGELIQFVVAHEVGHSLGLPHNMKASSMYPAEKVRDRDWVHKMGHCPSVMDYSRFNYVAQPEDLIALEDLIPRVGPYDRFAIRWGYKPVAGDEKFTLDQWAREQDKTPWLRFSTPGAYGIDAGDQTEAVGDADAVYATTWGLKNIRRAMDLLLRATSHYGESFEDLENMYGSLLGQWSMELRHVVPIVAGMNSQEKHAGQNGPIFEALPRQRQTQAVQFLLANAFEAPDWLLPVDVTTRVQPVGGLDRISQIQKSILSGLLSTSRLRRLAEQRTYPPQELMRDVRLGLFREFYSKVSLTVLRRRLQTALVDRLGEIAESGGDEAGLARQELKTLAADLKRASATSAPDKAHLAEVQERLRRLLDPRIPHEPARASTLIFRFLAPDQGRGCWDDYQKVPDLP